MKRKRLIPLLIVGPLIGMASLAVAEGGASAQCSVSDGILQKTASSERSDSVRCLQATLNEKGYNSGPVDGWFGPVTEGAVTSFQQANGLTVDGWMGRETRTALGIERSGSSGSTQQATRPAAPEGRTASAPAQRSSGSGGGGNGWTSGDCSSFSEEAAAAGLPWGIFSGIARRESGCNPNVWVVDHDDDGGGLFGFNYKGSMINFWPNLCGMSKGEVRGNVPLQMHCAAAAYHRSGLAPWRTTAG